MHEINGNAKTETSNAEQAARQAAMAVLSAAQLQEVADGLAMIGDIGASVDLRAPETGLVMLRGRVGGDGAPFNIGEATVTRCAVQLPSGEIGLSYTLGRDRKKSQLAALCDALWQTPTHRGAVESYVLAPIRQRIRRERDLTARRTAATRVDFFTMVRGEDPS